MSTSGYVGGRKSMAAPHKGRRCCLEKGLTARSLLLLIVLLHAGYAQSRKLFPSDTIPRDRLLSTGELLQLLDPTDPSLGQIHSRLTSGDTSAAASLFLDHLRSRPFPVYFFRPSEMTERVRAYAAEYPEDLDYAQRTARRYVEQYGSDVDWKVPGADLRGEAHTPNTVRFLARQLYAENFAVLALLRGDRTTADFQMAQLRDFLQDFAAGNVERGGNDVFERFYGGHRIRNLMMFQQMLLASEFLTDDDHMLLLRSFMLHGAIIIEKCSKFNWGNHQLVGLCALYEMTMMYPEFPVMREWNATVFTLILEHLEKEVKADGFQFERASHYFKLDIYNYFRVFQLAERNGMILPDWATDRYRRMFDAIVAVLMPNGSMPPLQDAQDTYIGYRNIDDARKSLGVSETSNSAELVDPSEGPFMALGAYLFREPRFKAFGDAKLHPAFRWFLPTDADDVYQTLAVSPPAFTSVALHESGYYVMRGGWEKNASYMIIDGGLAEYKPDHTHGGVLGVIAYSHGAMVLPNYRVRYSDPSYPFLKNSYVKNVALADSIEQGRRWIGNAARTGFGKWAWLPTPSVHRWVTGRSADFFSATHNAFDTVGVQYSRSIIFLRPSAWLVIDDFDGGSSPHTYQQLWQGSFTEGPGAVAATVVGPARLVVRQAEPSLTVSKGERYGTTSVAFASNASPSHTFITMVQASSSGETAGAGTVSRHEGTIRLSIGSTEASVTFPGHQFGTGKPIGSAVVRTRDASGQYCVTAIGVRTVDLEGADLLSDTSVSLELEEVSANTWEGRIFEGDAGSLSLRMSNGTISTIAVSGDKTFNIRW